jgi:hypothetical protein
MLQQVLEQAQGLEKAAAVAECGVHEPCCAGPDALHVCSEHGICAASARDVRSQLLICQLLGAVLSRRVAFGARGLL